MESNRGAAGDVGGATTAYRPSPPWAAERRPRSVTWMRLPASGSVLLLSPHRGSMHATARRRTWSIDEFDRRTFEFAGGWGGDHHDGVPTFVPTHRAPDVPPHGHARYVTDGIESCVAQGRRLFADLPPDHIELELLRSQPGSGALHLRYRIHSGG